MGESLRTFMAALGVIATIVGFMFLQMRGVEGRLTAQINGVETRLTDRIDRLEERADDRFLVIGEQNKEIIQRLTRLETLQGVGVGAE